MLPILPLNISLTCFALYWLEESISAGVHCSLLEVLGVQALLPAGHFPACTALLAEFVCITSLLQTRLPCAGTKYSQMMASLCIAVLGPEHILTVADALLTSASSELLSADCG